MFASVLGVLSLAELGFTHAIVSSMHKPVAAGDRELVCEYVGFLRGSTGGSAPRVWQDTARGV